MAQQRPRTSVEAGPRSEGCNGFLGGGDRKADDGTGGPRAGEIKGQDDWEMGW